jgi:hypothetical protein
MNSSVDLAVVTNLHLSVGVHCFKVMFPIALSFNTSSNVVYKSVGPGHSLQSQKKTFSLRCIANYRETVLIIIIIIIK